MGSVGSVGTHLRVGELSPTHRPRVEAIVRATGMSSDAEVAVALELFDEALNGRESGDAVPTPDPRLPTPGSASDYIFLGAFDSTDALLGFACYGPTPGTDRTYDLYWIAVDPAAQGAGAGTLLLTDVERRLRDANARLVVVETSGRAAYHATRAFYHARAYAEAARVRDFYGPADDRVVFTKRLEPLGPSHRPPSSSTTPHTGAE